MAFGKTAHEKESQRLEKDAEKGNKAFWQSPAGQASLAYDRGDQVFQTSLHLMDQDAVIVRMVGSMSPSTANDPTAQLNAVCNQGWELLSGAVTFVTTGEQSRDKFTSSGQNVAVKGHIMGYYLFKRAEQNKRS
jgi:hypothetical protein